MFIFSPATSPLRPVISPPCRAYGCQGAAFLKPTATAIVQDHGIGSEAVRVVEPLQGGSDTRVDIR